jgi:hypothetical protein
MRVEFRREGGFAGIPLGAVFDAESLSAEDAGTLRELMEAADFFNLPATTTPARGADRFQYVVTVEADGKRHTVRTTDAAAPEPLRTLLDFLIKLVRKRGKAGRSTD